MSNNYGLNKYKQTSITTASRGQIIIMLYEGCIKFLNKAIESIEKNSIAEKGTYIGKAQDIINELNNSLNHEVAGELTKELEKLYDYVFDLTTQANIKNDPALLQQGIKLLETLLDGWKDAVAQSGNLTLTKLESGENNGSTNNSP